MIRKAVGPLKIIGSVNVGGCATPMPVHIEARAN